MPHTVPIFKIIAVFFVGNLQTRPDVMGLFKRGPYIRLKSQEKLLEGGYS